MGTFDKPALTVTIPCRNAEAPIGVQLEALAKQNWAKAWELIVSDNESTDGSMDVVRRYQARIPRLRIVDSAGLRRQSHALNVAVRAALADAVAFCDADDEGAPGWVAAMGDALAQHDVVHGEIRYARNRQTSKGRQGRRRQGWNRGDGFISRRFASCSRRCGAPKKALMRTSSRSKAWPLRR